MVKSVDEFCGMNPKDVVSYIEGEPFISVVPVEPGLTNAEKITLNMHQNNFTLEQIALETSSSVMHFCVGKRF